MGQVSTDKINELIGKLSAEATVLEAAARQPGNYRDAGRAEYDAAGRKRYAVTILRRLLEEEAQ